jgi:outer membrane protein
MRYFMILALLLSTQSFAANAPGTGAIGVFDIRRALTSVAEGKKARETLQKEWEGREKKFAAEQKKLQEKADQLRKQSAVLDQKTLMQKGAELQGEGEKLQEQARQAHEEFAKRDQEISAPIVKKMREIVSKISKDRGYTMVLNADEGAVIFADPALDITDDVIKTYDSKK